MAGRSSGSTTWTSVCGALPRRVSEASSRLRSIWLIVAMPARTPTGMFLNTKQMTMIMAVPVISIGGTLKAKT